MERIVSGNNEFALNVYQKLAQTPGNIVCSPYSISSALVMVYAGAQGLTKDQMSEVLHFEDIDTFHSSFAAMHDHIRSAMENTSLVVHLANGLWFQRDFQLQENYLTLLKQVYDAAPHQVDFSNAFEKARLEINTWVSEQTRAKITELVPPGSLSAVTRLVLANAIYFNADWARPFPEKETHLQAFWIGDEQSIEVQTMHLCHNFRFFENDDIQLVELPYLGKEFSMLIVLPRAKKGLAQLEQNLTYQNLNSWLQSAQEKKIALALPRFSLRYTSLPEQTLSTMGMPLAFSQKADFTGISPEKLFISAIIHQASIDVQEKGTEASAATAAVFALASAVRPIEMIVDHPFLFSIRHNQTGAILFLGRVIDPR